MRRALHIIVGFGILASVGCADSSGQIRPSSHGSFRISVHGDSVGISPLTPLEAKAHDDANAFCEKQNKKLKLLGEWLTYGDVGVYPSAELEFKCAPRT
jgi:hypothetical protein